MDPRRRHPRKNPRHFQRYYMVGNVMEGHPEMSAEQLGQRQHPLPLRSRRRPRPRRLARWWRGSVRQTLLRNPTSKPTPPEDALKNVLLADVGANIPPPGIPIDPEKTSTT